MIKLRNLDNNDVDFIYENWTEENTLPGYNFKNSKEEILNTINIWKSKSYYGKYFEMFIIEAENKRVGLLSLYEQNSRSVSIGISIHPLFQNKGIGFCAVKIAVSKAKEDGWFSILSSCRTDNNASIALHKKCGFQITNKLINKRGKEVFEWMMNLK